ncbi:hypothetical protein B0H10DRAFT_2201496 [Mycena sp. CBHHK59/15]|nr:hypothetical protein B0H10DRAFT_2201496 [Mycena sp. CBHHK59/15]
MPAEHVRHLRTTTRLSPPRGLEIRGAVDSPLHGGRGASVGAADRLAGAAMLLAALRHVLAERAPHVARADERRGAAGRTLRAMCSAHHPGAGGVRAGGGSVDGDGDGHVEQGWGASAACARGARAGRAGKSRGGGAERVGGEACRRRVVYSALRDKEEEKWDAPGRKCSAEVLVVRVTERARAGLRVHGEGWPVPGRLLLRDECLYGVWRFARRVVRAGRRASRAGCASPRPTSYRRSRGGAVKALLRESRSGWCAMAAPECVVASHGICSVRLDRASR